MIGLAGRAGAGKTTLARLLRDRCGYTIVPFAAPLKAMMTALGVPDRHLYGSQAEKEQPLDILCGRSARQALQTLGTEWGRTLVGGEVWTNAWRAATLKVAGPVVCDDVRFDNEVMAVRSLRGMVVRIWQPGAGTSVPQHASEAGVAADVALLNWKQRPDDMLETLAALLRRRIR